MRQIVVALFVLIFSTSLATAQKVGFGVGLHGGIAIPAFEDLIKDFYNIGYGGGGHLDVNIVQFFSTRLNVEYYTFAADQDKLKEAIAPRVGLQVSDIASSSGGAVNVFIVTMNALGKIPTGSAVTPYALFGLGIHSISLSDISGTTTGGQSGTLTADDVGFKEGTKFGLDFGFGFEFAVAPSVDLSAEFKYVLVFTEDNSNGAMPITLGANFHL